MLILGLLGMYFDAAVVFFTNSSLFFQNGYGRTVLTFLYTGSATNSGTAVPGLGSIGLQGHNYKRFGAMVAFDNFQQFQENFYGFVDLFRKRPLDDEVGADFDQIDGLHVGSPPIQQPFMPPSFSGRCMLLF